MSEFGIIEKHFVPLTMGNEGSAGLKDDAAVIDIPDGHELVVTSDTVNEGIHFLEGEVPENIARKALRVNLSDLAAMAATPICYQLNIAFPEKPQDDWLKAFSDALYEDNKAFNIYCSGGDTTSIEGDRLSISITAMGSVPKGKAIRRGGAKDGDTIIITGALGDAALGLKVLQEKHDENFYKNAVARYRVPEPRVGIEDIMRQYVNAAADISDGVLIDCLRIRVACGFGAKIDPEKIEFSWHVQKAIENNVMTIEEAIKGGDDYELILAVSESHVEQVLNRLQEKNLNPFIIGSFSKFASSMSFSNSSSIDIDFSKLGWEHF